MMNAGVAVPATLAAAGLFAAASALQHTTAHQVPTVNRLTLTELATFARATLAHRLWLAGILCDIGGLGFHVLALHYGTLVLVQSLLVTGLAFALPIQRRLTRRSVSVHQLLWAVALVAALAMFLAVATPTASTATAADTGDTLVLVVIGLVIVGSCLAYGRRRPGQLAAVALGAATGIAFAATAALIKADTDLLAHGFTTLLSSWQLWTLIPVGAGGLLLNQLAFQAGPLPASLAAITITDPIASIIVGAITYNEQLHHGQLALAGEVIAMTVLIAAAIALTATEYPAKNA